MANTGTPFQQAGDVMRSVTLMKHTIYKRDPEIVRLVGECDPTNCRNVCGMGYKVCEDGKFISDKKRRELGHK